MIRALMRSFWAGKRKLSPNISNSAWSHTMPVLHPSCLYSRTFLRLASWRLSSLAQSRNLCRLPLWSWASLHVDALIKIPSGAKKDLERINKHQPFCPWLDHDLTKTMPIFAFFVTGPCEAGLEEATVAMVAAGCFCFSLTCWLRFLWRSGPLSSASWSSFSCQQAERHTFAHHGRVPDETSSMPCTNIRNDKNTYHIIPNLW